MPYSLRDIDDATLDAMVEADRERQWDALCAESDRLLEQACERALISEVWLSMPIHEDEPHRRDITLREYVRDWARFSTLTVRHYVMRDVWHPWATWEMVMGVGPGE